MKKFSKMLALGMALSLAFGVTAFAGSVTVGTSNVTAETAKDGVELKSSEVTVNGETVHVEMSAITEQFDEVMDTVKEQASKIVETAVGVQSATVAPKVVKAFEVEATDGEGNEASVEGKVTLTFEWTEVNSQKVYVAVHVVEGGDPEVVPVTVAGTMLTITLNGLSPVVIVEVGEKVDDTTTDPGTTTPTPGTPTTPSGNGNANNNNDNNTSNNNQSSSQGEAPKSPQTGEVLPMAGIMALICLAGAAVCAGKVRYNKQ